VRPRCPWHPLRTPSTLLQLVQPDSKLNRVKAGGCLPVESEHAISPGISVITNSPCRNSAWLNPEMHIHPFPKMSLPFRPCIPSLCYHPLFSLSERLIQTLLGPNLPNKNSILGAFRHPCCILQLSFPRFILEALSFQPPKHTSNTASILSHTRF
jgi:hypothetical protein